MEQERNSGRRNPVERLWALILAPFSAPELDGLRDAVDVTYESWHDTRELRDPEELAARLGAERTSILVIESDFIFEEMFEQATSLRFVGVCRAATNHVDIEAATARGILVVNTPARNARAVAEHALVLMLSLARRLPAVHYYVSNGLWRSPVEPYLSMRGIELGNRTLGIIGLGAIGGELASMAVSLGMKVIAFDPYVAAIPEGVRMYGLDALLEASDFVSIHAPHTPETDGLLDARRLALMRPASYLVNLSDAAIVSQEALVNTLRGKKIAGAALDVFETHPVSPDNPLLGMDNVVLTPHIGGATEETIMRHSRMMADDIRRFIAGEPPANLVNPDAWSARG